MPPVSIRMVWFTGHVNVVSGKGGWTEIAVSTDVWFIASENEIVIGVFAGTSTAPSNGNVALAPMKGGPVSIRNDALTFAAVPPEASDTTTRTCVVRSSKGRGQTYAAGEA